MKIFRNILSAALIIAVALSLPVFCLPINAGAPSLSAKSAILIDAEGLTIFEKNADARMGMASTTKIMTALVVTERLSPDTVVSIPPEAVNVEGSSVYLCEGELLTVEELLYALMLASANDAAVALAIAAAGSVESFAEKMNERAYELGLRDTHFVNPHGLNHEEHYTTARELARITAEALRYPSLRRIVATPKTTIPQGITPDSPEGAAERYLYNHNKMLRLYEGAIGVKTGFTKATGRCLVSAAERDGLTLIAVTLNASDDWNDHSAMLDYGYSLYERVTLFGVGEFTCSYPVTGGREQYVTLANSQPITLTLKKNRAKTECAVYSPQRFEFAPVTEGALIATLHVSVGDAVATSPLIAAHGVEARKKK